MVQVSFSTTTSFEGDLNALVEAQNTALTVRFELDEPAPAGGLKVFVDSDVEQIVSRLDLPGFIFNPTVENINPNLVGTSFDNSGFFLTINEGATFGSFTINVFDNTEPDTFLPDTFDGRVDAVFSLKTQDQVSAEDLGDVSTLSDYTIDPNAATSTVVFADTADQLTDTPEPPNPPQPPTSNLPLVSLHTGPDFLVEEEGTVSAHVFNVTNATIPEGGLVVSVSAPGLGEFALDSINVSEGGEIATVRGDGFDIRLTDFTVLVDLPVAVDGETEGLETARFTLEAGDGYEVNSDFSSGEFTLVDTADEVPDDTLEQPNNIIPLAVETGLNADNPVYTATTSIAFDIGNRYLNEDGTFTYIDMTEDVDLYSFELSAGDVITVDVDSDAQRGEPPAAVSEFMPNPVSSVFTGLRIFDSGGEELLASWIGQGPGELFVSYDGYVEFVAPEDGTYYLGISGQNDGNNEFRRKTFGIEAERYDPFVPGTGDTDSFPEFEFPSHGEYDLTISLNPDVVLELPQFFGDNVGGGNPNSISEPDPDKPIVSLGYVTGTFDLETDDLVNPYLSEGLPSTNSALILTLNVEGEIPEEGILVDINTDNYLRQYIAARTFQSTPFTPGSQVEQFIFDETGRETGFQLRIFEPYTFIGLSTQSPGWADLIEPDVDEPEDVTWFIEPGEDYAIAPDAGEFVATYYEPGQTPELTVIPEVEMSISETEFIESEQTVGTLNFTLSEPPPEEGVLVQVDGSGAGILQQFDIFNIEIDGGVFPSPTEVFTGFLFKMTEQEASITLPVFQDPFDEGLQGFSFTLAEATHYTVDSNASEVAYTIADTPDSVLEVGISSDRETLVESENPTGVITFNLTTNPPAEGVTVTVDAPNLSEFDAEALTITGGEVTEITDSGFSLNITDVTATVELSVLSDGEEEGLETATFALVDSVDSTINPDTNEATLSLVDNLDQVPVTAEHDANDTIDQALDINLNPENPNPTIRGGLFTTEPEQTGGLGGFFPLVNDPSEDVDFYSFDLNAGDTVKIDVDAVGALNLSLYEGIDLRLDSELRLFDADGNELASVNNAAAPDEEFSRDPYLEFTAEEAGTYYVGVSQLGNDDYDPNVAGSGSGWIFPEIGVYVGEYDLSISLIETVPILTDAESNDTIPTAQSIGLSAENPAVIVTGAISQDLDNNPGVDLTEDVDFYKFDLTAGDTIVADVDALQLGSAFEGSITLFDAEGNILITDVGESTPLPEEVFLSQWDPNFEYTVEADGTYYLGVASYPNYDPNFTDPPTDPIDIFGSDSIDWLYDPFTPGSGTGSTTGEYTLNLTLNGATIPSDETSGETSDTPDPSSEGGDLVISFNTVEGTYGPDFDVDQPGLILSQSIVEEVEEGGSALAFSLSANGDLPPGGFELVINSDAPLGDYLTSINFPPFSPGTQVLGPVLDPDTGEATGIRFLMQAPNVMLSLPVFDNETEDGPRQVTYTLEPGAGYTVDAEASSSTVTFYDTLDQAPAPTIEPEVSLSVSTTELIESEGTTTTLTFELSEALSEGGTLVYVDSGAEGSLGELNVLAAEVTGGAFPVSNGLTSGFYFRITEQIATITLSAFPDNNSEGIETFTYGLQPGVGYTVAEGADAVSVTIADTPNSQITVSYSAEPEDLIEADGTISVHTFSLSSDVPAEGVTISVSAPNLDEFDLTQLAVGGGEIVEVRADGFDLKLMAREVVVSVPINADGVVEGYETGLPFTVEAGDGYEVSSDANSATFNIADAATDLPLSDVEVDPQEFPAIINDTIPLSQDLGLSPNKTSVVVNGAIGEVFGQIDSSEDVDLYSFKLLAGDSVYIDLDSAGGETQLLDAQLRLLNSDGEELLLVDNAASPDETETTTDPYLEFTATESGTYYVGVSQLGNISYDPFVAGSGSGIILSDGFEPYSNIGEYELDVTLMTTRTSIDFNSGSQGELSAGDVVTDQFAGMTISTPGSPYGAMIFDSANPTGGDTDLLALGLGNVLIISEDGDSSDPDDNAKGGILRFEWDSLVGIASVGVLDVEETDGSIQLYGSNDELIQAFEIPALENNSFQEISLGISGVARMDVMFVGSAALTDINFLTSIEVDDVGVMS